MPVSARVKGRPASPGYAEGRIHLARDPGDSDYVPASSAEGEIEALQTAIAVAISELQTLVDSAAGDAVDILEFQLAMLADDTFFEAASGKIGEGVQADSAWRDSLDEEIVGYLASDDEYFKARSADLTDIRDRVLGALTGAGEAVIPAGSIYVGDDLTPSAFLSHDWRGGGIVLRRGSATSHVAMLARAAGIPAIIGIGAVGLEDGASALLDAEQALLIADPDANERDEFQAAHERYLKIIRNADRNAIQPALTAEGERVEIFVNIADPCEVDAIDVATVDGVGLMRTEFLFGGEHGLPDEDEQYTAYRKVLEWAAGKPVIIRTADIGGDKPIEGYSVEEDNAFLGMRGIRLSLRRPAVFRQQIRALLRAARFGKLKVMLPMVSVPTEIDRAIALFEEEARLLAEEGVDHAMPEIGIMVEVPSVAVQPARFARAAFFSIGSNDLTQYVLAVSRDNADLSELADPADPSVLALIENIVEAARAQDREVSLCGDAASDTRLVPLLLQTGLRKLSVAASRIGMVKEVVRAWRKAEPAPGLRHTA